MVSEAAFNGLKKGAEILFYPTAIGWLASEKKAEWGISAQCMGICQVGHACQWLLCGLYQSSGHRKKYRILGTVICLICMVKF